jgi:hypothetical protein
MAGDDKYVEYRLLLGKRTFEYAEIKEIKISRVGYLVFVVDGDKNAYGFMSRKLRKVIGILQSKGVEVSDEELRKLTIASNVALAQYLFVIAFTSLWLSGLLYALGLIIAHL